jgi:hypothetical protein
LWWSLALVLVLLALVQVLVGAGRAAASDGVTRPQGAVAGDVG